MVAGGVRVMLKYGLVVMSLYLVFGDVSASSCSLTVGSDAHHRLGSGE